MADLQFLPSFEPLCQALESQGEVDAEEALFRLREFELEVQDMCQALHAQSLDHLYEPELQELLSPTLENYQRTYFAIDSLRDALESGQPWEDSWKEAQSRLSLALADYPALASWHERQPRLSPSPYIHDLVRVGRACLQGKLPWEAFDTRLAHYQEVLQEFWERYQHEELQLGSWRLSFEQRSGLEALLERISLCVEELADVDSDPGRVESGLQSLLQQTEELFQWQREIQLDFEQPLRGELACPRCGQANGKTLRVCQRCGARLPLVLMESLHSVDFHSDRPATDPPSLVAELMQAIERFSHGELAASRLLEQVAKARGRAHSFNAQLRRLPDQGAEATGEAGFLLESGRQLLQRAHENYRELLQEIEEAVKDSDLRLLLSLKERLAECGSLAHELQGISQQLNHELQDQN